MIGRQLRHSPNLPWLIAALMISAAVLWPVLSIVQIASKAGTTSWPHLASFVLPNALKNTTLLLLGVGLLTALIGSVTAWLVSAYEFPARRILSWALLLPLAVPSYIVAYAYTDFLHPLGPLQTALRSVLEIDSPRDLRLPDVRTLWILITLMSLVLYPYVFLSVRALFLTQAGSLLDAARSLGCGGRALFVRVAMPLARPAIVVGVTLVLLETLNDIGAAKIFGIETLTSVVFSTWINRNDLAAAAQIASSMLLLVIVLIALERLARADRRFSITQRPQAMSAQRLRGRKALLAAGCCALPVVLGFVIPMAYLLHASSARWLQHGFSSRLFALAINSLQVALCVSVITLCCGWLLSFALRAQPARWLRALLHAGSLGYAVPGVVLAIGLLTPMAVIDAAFAGLAKAVGASDQSLLLGSIAGVVLACSLRFLAIAVNSFEAGYARIPQALDHAARSLAAGPAARAWRVHFPLLQPSIAAAALFIFIDTMKELPATLLLRPLNFDTLATWLYAEAARGSYEEGALAALLIVLIGLPAVALLARVGTTQAKP